MALTPEEVQKVNDLFQQIDEKDTQLEAKEKLLTEKEILLNKTRVTLNEKQSILTQKEQQIADLTTEVETTRQQMMCYKDVQKQLSDLNEKIDKLFAKGLSDAPTKKTTTKKTTGVASRKTKD